MTDRKINIAYAQYKSANAATHQANIAVGASGIATVFGPSTPLVPVPPFAAGGTVSGYSVGGSAPIVVNTIQKFSFTSDGNATDVGEMTVGRDDTMTASAPTAGYAIGPYSQTSIDKWPFTSDTPATNIASLNPTRLRSFGSSSESETHGYFAGGYTNPSSTNYTGIDKIPFASDTAESAVGSLSTPAGYVSQGTSGETHGYVNGGRNPGTTPQILDIIQKYSYSSDGNATDVGELFAGIGHGGAFFSPTNSYVYGGYDPAFAAQDIIVKYPFASESTGSDVTELSTPALIQSGSSSSTTNGYTLGGFTPTRVNSIQRIPYSTETTAGTIGALTTALDGAGGAYT